MNSSLYSAQKRQALSVVSRQLNGLIHEVRLSTGALYTSNFTPATQLGVLGGTLGLWKFDGQSTNDSTGNGNNGVLIGSATFSTDMPTLSPVFSVVPVASPIANPTAMAFAPDGRLFVCQQTGQLRVIENGVLLPDSFVNLTVNSAANGAC